MACNCGKKVAPVATDRDAARPVRGIVASDRDAPSAPSAASTASGAPRVSQNPSSGDGVVQSFTLMTPDSRSQVFGSRLEAEAARVRAGNVGRILAR